nr:MAG TPA: hypothetical protein [Caudoviricetes sp.]
MSYIFLSPFHYQSYLFLFHQFYLSLPHFNPPLIY